VLLPASGAAAKALGQPDAKSSFVYGTLNNAKIVNNGHTLQVTLPADFKSDVKIPIKGGGLSLLSCCRVVELHWQQLDSSQPQWQQR
jgi:hypothetical protein